MDGRLAKGMIRDIWEKYGLWRMSFSAASSEAYARICS